MGITNTKGELGEAIVFADLQRQGHGVAIPWGHDMPFDLIVVRKENGALEKVQVKYTESDGKVVQARATSTSAWVHHTYTADEVDWIAVYDLTTDRCYYVPAGEWNGFARLSLRLVPTANNQVKGIRLADDFKELVGDPQAPKSPSRETEPPLSLDFVPE